MYLLLVYQGTRKPFETFPSQTVASDNPAEIVSEIKRVEEKNQHCVMVVYRFDSFTIDNCVNALLGMEKSGAITLIQSNEKHPQVYEVYILQRDLHLLRAGWEVGGIGEIKDEEKNVPWG